MQVGELREVLGGDALGEGMEALHNHHSLPLVPLPFGCSRGGCSFIINQCEMKCFPKFCESF